MSLFSMWVILNSYGFYTLTFFKFFAAKVKFSFGSKLVKNVNLSVRKGWSISSKYLVLWKSMASESRSMIRSSYNLAESITLIALSLNLPFIFSVRSLGTGPCALPPFFLYGALLLPYLAAPLPFYGTGFFPEPATSPLLLTILIFLTPFTLK